MSEAPGAIEYSRYGAARGLLGLREAAAMFARARIAWLMLLLAYYMALATLRMLPLVGVFLVPLLKPVFAVGFLAAAWTVERGGKPRLRHLLQGFQSNLRALLPLGVVFVIGITIAVMASAVVDQGKLMEFLSNPPAGVQEGDAAAADAIESVLLDTRVQLGMLFAALCALPVLLALWFAPALIVFQDMRARAALSTSLRAALANWRALLVYALAVFVFAGLTPTMLVALLSMLLSGFPDELRATLTYAIVLPYVAMLIAILQISDYICYRDVFHAQETPGPLPPPMT
ncbi:MAG: BPSS1780 family membrane protein [Casimicrobiaceae bacterium]